MWSYILAIVVVVSTFGLIQGQAQDTCIQCDSATERSCNQPDGNALARICDRPSSQSCYMRVFDRRVIRGCAVDLQEDIRGNCRNETLCELCVGFENCNVARFPLHRTFCHQCEGGVNSTCSGELASISTICEFYEPNDQCFISFDGTTFRRGCVSSNDHCRQQGNCFTCSGIGCNFVEYNGSNSLFKSFNFSFVLFLSAFASKIFY